MRTERREFLPTTQDCRDGKLLLTGGASGEMKVGPYGMAHASTGASRLSSLIVPGRGLYCFPFPEARHVQHCSAVSFCSFVH